MKTVGSGENKKTSNVGFMEGAVFHQAQCLHLHIITKIVKVEGGMHQPCPLRCLATTSFSFPADPKGLFEGGSKGRGIGLR